MAFYDFLFKGKKKKNKGSSAIVTQNGTTARLGTFGDNLLESDTVQQCIGAIAKEMKKTKPRHIWITEEGAMQIVRDSKTTILARPNKSLSISDFIEKSMWFYYGRDNTFIFHDYEWVKDKFGALTKSTKGLYILNPVGDVNMYDDEKGETLQIGFHFYNFSGEVIYNYEDIIHLKRNFGLNEFYGGDKYGRPNNAALLKTVKINHRLLESVEEGINSSYSVNGLLKYNTMLSDKKMEDALNEFNHQLENNKSGILGVDMKADYTPITKNVKMVDKDTLDFLDKKILRNYGVSQAILDGTATAEEKRAFYETTLEPLIVMLEQAFTNCMFTEREIARGNKIQFFTNTAETMTNQQKLEQATLFRDIGAKTNNQLLAMFGEEPYEGGDIRLMSLNYVNVDIANQYQLGNAGATQQQEEKPKEEELNNEV